MNRSGFGDAYLAPISWGTNDGLRANIDAAAHFLWEPSRCDGCTVYFSAQIVPLAIPEPHTYALLLAGLALLGFAARCATPQAEATHAGISAL